MALLGQPGQQGRVPRVSPQCRRGLTDLPPQFQPQGILPRQHSLVALPPHPGGAQGCLRPGRGFAFLGGGHADSVSLAPRCIQQGHGLFAGVPPDVCGLLLGGGEQRSAHGCKSGSGTLRKPRHEGSTTVMGECGSVRAVPSAPAARGVRITTPALSGSAVQARRTSSSVSAPWTLAPASWNPFNSACSPRATTVSGMLSSVRSGLADDDDGNDQAVDGCLLYTSD